MPISKEQFNEGREGEPIISKIQDFLALNRDRAFTEGEILKNLYPEHTAWPADHNGFNSAVPLLAYAGKIEVRHISTSEGIQVYFRAK